MKPDLSTKVILTAIACFLGVIALGPLVTPIGRVYAQGPANPRNNSSAATRWEYKVLILDRGDRSLDFDSLSEDGNKVSGDWLSRAGQLGSQGWEVTGVQALSNHTGTMYAGMTTEVLILFKRPQR